MNLLTNAGWETDDGWTYSPIALALDDADAYQGARVCLIRAGETIDGEPFFGKVEQSVDVLVGRVYELSVYVRQDSGSCALSLRAGIDELVRHEPGAAGWQRISGFFTATASALTFVVEAFPDQSGGATGIWSLDAASLEVVEATDMQSGTWQAYLAMRDRLLTITPANGYWHDVAGKVLPKLVVRGESDAPKPPYICLPAFGPIGGDLDSDTATTTWPCPVYVILEENNSADFAASASVDAGKWHDDILRAVMPTEVWRGLDLGSAHVKHVEFTGGTVHAEAIEAPVAFLLLTFAIHVIHSRADLGPGD